MYRRLYARLAMAAGALVLVAGMALPACAQDEKTPAFAQVLPADGQVLITWAAVKDATGYNVYRRNVGQDISAAKLVNATPTKDTSLPDTGLKNGTPLIYAVKAIFSDGSMGDPAEASGTPQAPVLTVGTSKFALYDIATINPGSVAIDASNVLTIKASGGDIWDANDNHSFLATPVTGDFTITMKLLEDPAITDDNSSDFGKVGLQAKYSITPGDPYALVFASVSRSPEYMFEGRRNAGGGDTWSGGSVDFDQAKFPAWLRLQRVGKVFSALYSLDGTTFQKSYDSQTMSAAPDQVYVGIAATAHNSDYYVVGKIDAKSITLTTP